MLGKNKCPPPAICDEKNICPSKKSKKNSSDSQKSSLSEEAEEINWDLIELNIEQSVTEESNLLMSSIAIKQNSMSSPDCLIENEDYHCFFCPFVFSTNKQLREHLHRYHADKKQCFFCKKGFTSLFVLVEHLTVSHSRENFEFKCNSCEIEAVYTNSSPFKFLRHINLRHNKKENMVIPDPTPPMVLYNMCKFCKCGFKHPDNLFLHLVKCHDIDFRFVHKLIIKFKMLSQSVVLCTECPMVFEKIASFKEHIQGAYCKYFRKHYHELTRFCEGCLAYKDAVLFHKKGLTADQQHCFCPYPQCVVHQIAHKQAKVTTEFNWTNSKADCYISIYKHCYQMPAYCRAFQSYMLFSCELCHHRFHSYINKIRHECPKDGSSVRDAIKL